MCVTEEAVGSGYMLGRIFWCHLFSFPAPSQDGIAYPKKNAANKTNNYRHDTTRNNLPMPICMDSRLSLESKDNTDWDGAK